MPESISQVSASKIPSYVRTWPSSGVTRRLPPPRPVGGSPSTWWDGGSAADHLELVIFRANGFATLDLRCGGSARLGHVEGLAELGTGVRVVLDLYRRRWTG